MRQVPGATYYLARIGGGLWDPALGVCRSKVPASTQNSAHMPDGTSTSQHADPTLYAPASVRQSSTPASVRPCHSSGFSPLQQHSYQQHTAHGPILLDTPPLIATVYFSVPDTVSLLSHLFSAHPLCAPLLCNLKPFQPCSPPSSLATEWYYC